MLRREGEVPGSLLRYGSYLKLGQPVSNPLSTLQAVSVLAPEDATCFERTRDRVLKVLCGRRIAKLFIGLALTCIVLIISNILVIAWAMFGLYFGVRNGGQVMSPACLTAAAALNQTLQPNEFPVPHGSISHCSVNQWVFNGSIKGFVCLFSYINFLPVPWRIAIFHHSWLSRRPSTPGLDFYGRPTETMWFNLPQSTRRLVSALLNLAYISHFVSQVFHLVFWTYVEGQTLPGALAQNLPFGLSIFCAVAAGYIQENAENALIAAHPDRYPPRLGHLLRCAWRRWRQGEGGLLALIRDEMGLPNLVSKKLARASTAVMLASLRGYDKS
eukprot:jgi/Chrpa1/8694/Chrysochromulina_OHIO_Genome00009275-RA